MTAEDRIRLIVWSVIWPTFSAIAIVLMVYAVGKPGLGQEATGPRWGLSLLGYWFLICAGFGLVNFLRWKMPGPGLPVLCVPLFCVVFGLVIALDFYCVPIQDGHRLVPHEEAESVHVYGWRRRWWPSWMTIVGSSDRVFSIGGRLTDSGKRHGQWSTVFRPGKFIAGENSHFFGEEWFWYGDPVSEGEWARLTQRRR